MKTITISCENTGCNYNVEAGMTLKEIKKIIYPENHNHILEP